MNPQPSPSERSGSAPELPRDWVQLPLEHLPAATFWPAGLALAITLIFWGLLASWVILVIGLALFAVSLGGWINDLRHERKHHP